MQQELLDCITFPYDDATRRKLLILYKQKESLFDGEILQEHLLSQPLLGVFLLLFAILSLASFVFAIIFIACRALGNCGAKRYQTHPTKGRRYVLFLVMVIISWVGLAGATVHFLTSAIELWNPPLDRDANEVPSPRHHSVRYTALQRGRRDTDDMTVRQLFEDSDYVGDFEQIDATTAAAFVTEKLKPNSSTFDELKQRKKLVDLKNAKRIRFHDGHHTKTSTAASSSTSPVPKYFVIKTKPTTEMKSKIPPNTPPQYGRQPHRGFMTRGIASIKAIRQPFVSDTWSNAGKQAYYRHNLSPTLPRNILERVMGFFLRENDIFIGTLASRHPHTNSSSPSSTAILLDNSVTRTEQPDLVLSKPKEATEVESFLHNFIANDSVEPAEKASTTTLVSTTTTEVTEPSSTTRKTSLSSEITTTEEAIEALMTSTTESTDGEITSIKTAASEEAETTTQPSKSSEEIDATTAIEISGEVSDFSEEKETTALASEESIYTSDNPTESSTSEGTAEASTTSLTTSAQTTASTTTSPTTKVQTTASTTTSSTTSVQTTTSTTTTAVTSVQTTTSTSFTTSTTREHPTESTTFTTLIKTTLPPTVPSTTADTEPPTVRTTTAKTFRAHSRSDIVEKKHKTIYDEEDKLVALKIPPTLRVKQLNSTAALIRQQDRSEFPKTQRKSRFETRSTFPAEKLTVVSKQNTTSAVMPVFQEQISWAARFFVLFIGIVMVLLILPTPILVTAGTVCYMRSYHPMDRTAFSEKVGQLCVVLATVFLFFTPCLYFYLDVLLAYIHVYFAMCPSIRLLHQFRSLSLEELSMLDAKVSASNNVHACRRSSEAYQGIWSACFAFVLFSIPTLLALFKLSKYYLRMKTEYYWNVGDGYGVIRPKVATTTDAIYGNIYGTVQRKRPGTKPPPRPVYRTPVSEPAAYGVYIEQPTYGVFK